MVKFPNSAFKRDSSYNKVFRVSWPQVFGSKMKTGKNTVSRKIDLFHKRLKRGGEKKETSRLVSWSYCTYILYVGNSKIKVDF